MISHTLVWTITAIHRKKVKFYNKDFVNNNKKRLIWVSCFFFQFRCLDPPRYIREHPQLWLSDRHNRIVLWNLDVGRNGLKKCYWSLWDRKGLQRDFWRRGPPHKSQVRQKSLQSSTVVTLPRLWMSYNHQAVKIHQRGSPRVTNKGPVSRSWPL